jgi:hypothetical protein
LLAAPKARDFKGGAKALSALAQLDPAALRGEEVAKAAMALANGAALAQANAETADEIFQLLAQSFGSDGVDVLYRILDSHAATHPAAKRASVLLGEPQVLARATPSLTVAVQLRAVPCEEKPFLFDRAATFGDARALKVLEKLRARPCRNAKDACCFRTSQDLRETIARLDGRLKAAKK